MYPLTCSVAFTICDEYYQVVARAKAEAKIFAVYAKSSICWSKDKTKNMFFTLQGDIFLVVFDDRIKI